MNLISDAIFYFGVGMILGIILFLVVPNLLILTALIFGRQGQARRLQHFLDKFAWPFRLGGGM
jgi:predicted RND superfamily exporter protein